MRVKVFLMNFASIKSLGDISLLLTGLILVLHLVTPHVHHDLTGSSKQVEQSAGDNLLDWLVDFFDHDLGEGHLETFEKASNSSISSTVHIPYHPSLLPYFQTAVDIAQVEAGSLELVNVDGHLTLNLPEGHQQSNNGLRAPPVLA